MDVINAKSNTYPFVEVVIYSKILRTNCRVNQSRFSPKIVFHKSHIVGNQSSVGATRICTKADFIFCIHQ